METLPIENLIGFIFSISIWNVAKILVCFAILLYLLFAFVVLKQVNLMTETLTQLEAPLKTLAILHLIVVIVILLIALVVL